MSQGESLSAKVLQLESFQQHCSGFLPRKLFITFCLWPPPCIIFLYLKQCCFHSGFLNPLGTLNKPNTFSSARISALPFLTWHQVSHSCRSEVSTWVTSWAYPISGSSAHTSSPTEEANRHVVHAADSPSLGWDGNAKEGWLNILWGGCKLIPTGQECSMKPENLCSEHWAGACFTKLPGCLGSGCCFPTRSKPSGQQMMFTSCDIILKSNII